MVWGEILHLTELTPFSQKFFNIFFLKRLKLNWNKFYSVCVYGIYIVYMETEPTLINSNFSHEMAYRRVTDPNMIFM